MRELYLGMLSGTSMDGVDAVLAEIGDSACEVRHAATTPFPTLLRGRLERIVAEPQTSLQELGSLDNSLGHFFAQCALDLLASAGVSTRDIAAIGHHGQTVFHAPTGQERFTMQIGDPNVVAAETDIPTVSDFRRLDMAVGGQGAPLAPGFHAWRFGRSDAPRAVVNIGGIANITLLPPGAPPMGFDTGPGNTLLDIWIGHCLGERFDREGAWSATGRVDSQLLASFLEEPYFASPAPKSTGRELFHLNWLETYLQQHPGIVPVDVQSTLAELTAQTIVAGISEALPSCEGILVCGGGAHNRDLMQRIALLTKAKVESTEAYGLAPDWVEGAMFAWLARARLRRDAANVPTVTGAHRPVVLGALYCAGTSRQQTRRPPNDGHPESQAP